MKKILILLAVALMAVGAQAQKRALLIIDVQDFYFSGPDALAHPDETAQKSAILLSKFRSAGELVVHVKHKSGNGEGIYYRVKPADGEKVILKTKINSFLGTDLDEYLKANGITDLVICGMMTHMCVQAAFRAATDLGYKCTLVEDACTTRNLTFNGTVTLAKDVHNSVLASLKGFYGDVTTLEDFLAKENK